MDTEPRAPSPIPAFVNPTAGSAAAAIAAISADARFELREVEPAALQEAITDAVARGARRVLVSGGDGTVANAAASLTDGRVELAVLPGGTLNHFARDHDIPTEPGEALALARDGHAQPTDVGYVNERLFHGTSSLGAYIRYVGLRERMRPRVGYRLASMLAAVRVLATLRTYRVTIQVEGVARTYNTPAIFIGVGERELKPPTLGGRVPSGQRALHVLVASGGRARQLVFVALLALARGVWPAARTRWLDAFLVEELRVDPPRRGIALAVDGEVIELEAPLRYRLERDALLVVRP